MAENRAEPTLVDIADNPLPVGGEAGWLYLPRGKVWLRSAMWPAAVDEPQGTVIVATGRAEFIEKYYETIEDLLARGFAVASFDWRGQGGSSRLVRNPMKGYVASFDDYVDDLEAAVAGAAARGLPRPYYLLAHSMGATVALLAASRLSGQIERMVLTAPLIEFADKRAASGWARTLGAVAAGIGLAGRSVRPGKAPAPQDAPFENNAVTSDPRRFARTQAVLRAEPRLGLGAPTVRWFTAANRAIRDLAEPTFGEEIKIPALVVACGMDRVVSVRALERFAKTLRAGGRVLIPGARHEILMERTAFRTLFWAAFDAFVPGSDLRLSTQIAPPKVRITPPSGTGPASVPALAASASTASEPGVAETAAGETATAEAPAPETARAAEDSNPRSDAVSPSETEPATATQEEPVEALAPAAPEAAETGRRRFGLFGRRKRADRPAETAPATPDAMEQSEGPAPAGETGRTSDPAPVSAEAALAAATSLVVEATRGEPKTPTSNDATPPASAPTEPETAGAGAAPEPAAKPEAVQPADVAPGSDAKRNGRVGRLFRRRGNGTSYAPESDDADEKADTAEAASDTPSEPESAADTDKAPAATDPAGATAAPDIAEDDTPKSATAPVETATADAGEAVPVEADEGKADAAGETAPGQPDEPPAAASDEDKATSATISVTTAPEEPDSAPADAEAEAPAPKRRTRGKSKATVRSAKAAKEAAPAPDETSEAAKSELANLEAMAAEPQPTSAPSETASIDSAPTEESAPAAPSRARIGGTARPTPRPVSRGRGRSGKR